MRRALTALALLSLCAAAPAGAVAQTVSHAPSADTVAATVNGEKILGSDIVLMHKSLPPQYRQIPLADIYGQLIDRIIDQRLIAAEARKSGFLRDPEVKRRLEFLMEGMIQQVYIDAKLKTVLAAGNLRRVYKERIAGMPRQEQVRASHILLKTEAEAKKVIAELKGGADFAELARRKSTGPSGKSGGDLGFFGKSQMVPPFSKAAFAMNKGEVTPAPVKTQFGWHVIKVMNRRFSSAKSFEEMSDELRDQLTQETVDAIINKLRGKAEIKKMGSSGITRVP